MLRTALLNARFRLTGSEGNGSPKLALRVLCRDGGWVEYGGEGGAIMVDAADGRRLGCDALIAGATDDGFLTCRRVSGASSYISFPSLLFSVVGFRAESSARQSLHRLLRCSSFGSS